MDSNLQNKLQAFNAPPPEGVWNKIADALDAEETFPQRLYQYEEQPPAAFWGKLENALNAEIKEPKVIPINPFKKFFRYGAVACFIAVLLVTVTLTVRRTEAGALQAGSNTTVPTNKLSPVVPETGTQQKSSAETTAAQQKDPPLAANNTNDNTVASSREIVHETKASKAMLASFNEYVSFRDGDGKMRRVAKKLAGFVKCKDGDEACQQRLQLLRQTLAANATTTDFTGILEMLRGLQQKP